MADINLDDPRHDRAHALMARVFTGELGMALSTDLVLGEGLALLRKRPGREKVSRGFVEYFYGSGEPGPLDMALTGHEVIEPAIDLHFKHYDRGLSFTDCTLIVHANRLGAKLATFDSGFEGLVEVVRE